MNFTRGRRQIAVAAMILGLIATAAFAAGGFDRLTHDTVKIGSGTSTDKVIDFDTGAGASDSKLTATSAGTMTFGLSGTTRATLATTGLTTTVPSLTAAGSASAPAYSYSGDANTGAYSVGADDLGFATGGTLRVDISTTSMTSTIPILGSAGSASAPSHSFSGDPNTGMYSAAADDLGFTSGGTLRLDLSTTAFTSTLPYRASAGSASAPSLSFSGNTNTGIYNPSANVVGITAGGTERFEVTGAGVSSLTDPFFAIDGTTTAPSFSFTSDSNTGMYRTNADHVGFAAGGTTMVEIGANGIASGTISDSSAIQWKVCSGTLTTGATAACAPTSGAIVGAYGMTSISASANRKATMSTALLGTGIYFDDTATTNSSVGLKNGDSVTDSYRVVVIYQ